jgi:HPt (histidine-containing phosphotransfer) domain-containing protein
MRSCVPACWDFPSLEEQEGDTAGRLAHRIKGAALIANLPDIGHLAEQLETVIHSSVPGSAIEAARIRKKLHEAIVQLPGADAPDHGPAPNDKA